LFILETEFQVTSGAKVAKYQLLEKKTSNQGKLDNLNLLVLPYLVMWGRQIISNNL
jgi:hypothetical protein